MGLIFTLALIISFAIWCGLGVSLRKAPAVLWGTTVLTAILALSIIFLVTRTVRSEAEAFTYGMVASCLILALAFSFPLAVVSWFMRIRLRGVRTKKAVD